MAGNRFDRRKLGRYDTPERLSKAIVGWAIRCSSDRVLEPSSGSGVFVQNALDRLKALGSPEPRNQVWACDIDPKAWKQTTQNGRLHHSHVWRADFLTLVNLTGIRGRKFSSIVGNPPYVSLHRMSLPQRLRARSAIDRLEASLDFKASLWAYFVLVATCALQEDGRLAMILPEAVLHADYARKLLRIISRRFGSCTLLSVRERFFLNDGAGERVVILLVDAFRSRGTSENIFLHEAEDIEEAESFLVQPETKPGVSRHLNGHAVPHLIRTDGTIDLANQPSTKALGEFADIKIGVVTGANKFFLINESARQKLRLPESALIRILPRFVECRGLAFGAPEWQRIRDTEKPCWLILPNVKEKRKSVLNYLRRYSKEAKGKNVTFGKRKPWYRVDLGKSPDAFLRYMGTSGPRLALSTGYANCTNTIHRVYFKRGISQLQQRTVAISLHSSFSQLSAEFEGRAYGLGVLKLEPSEAKRLRLLMPAQVTEADVNKRFTAIEKALAVNNHISATELADDWLYKHIPSLAATMPLQTLRSQLALAIKRRTGAKPIKKPRIRKNH